MIRDVIEFRRSGLACRRVAELDIPVQAWRAAMRHAGRREDARVHTFLIPPHPATPADLVAVVPQCRHSGPWIRSGLDDRHPGLVVPTRPQPRGHRPDR